MDATQNIPDEALTIAQAIDDTRVEEKSHRGYFRLFGESYKGHYRGGLLGVLSGAAFGALAAAVACFLMPGLLMASAPIIIAAAAGVGAMVGGESLSVVGSASSSRAAALAEKHARLSDPIHGGNDLSALDDKLMADGRGYHYEFVKKGEKGKLYRWKSGIIGASIMAGFGGLMGVAGVLTNWAPVVALAHWAPFAALVTTATPPVALVAGVGAVACGLIGLTFGLERSIFKSIFNQADANIQGKIHDGHHGPDLGRTQFREKESDRQIYEHRLHRQEEMDKLQTGYRREIFLGAVNGRFRGLAGGLASGALVGGAVGAVAFGIICLGGFPGLALLGTLTAGFAAAGGLLGMSIFSEAGTEAGAEATARAIDEEFERNRILKANGIALAPAETPKPQWFNGKALLIAGLGGAALGAAVSPVVMVPSALAMLHLPAAAALGVSVITGALGGMTYGIGRNFYQSASKTTDAIYDKIYFAPRQSQSPALEHTVAPQRVTAQDVARLNERLGANATEFIANIFSGKVFERGKERCPELVKAATQTTAQPRSANVRQPIVFVTTSSTLVSPVGAYAGRETMQYSRRIAEQQFQAMQSSQGASIN